MGFLDFVERGGGGLITGLTGTIAGAISGAKDRKLQEKLQQQQMKYGREMYALQSADEHQRMEQQTQMALSTSDPGEDERCAVA